jgi:hypothetical protein
LVRIQRNEKLFLTISSLLLLTLVTNSGSYLQKGLAASDTRIVAAGDWHCTPDAAKAISVAKSLKPQLILGLGDYSSTETDDCWVNLSKPIDSITQIAIGNHDNEYDGLATSYLSHYGLTKQFYSYDIGNVHVLTMATEDDFKVGSEQYNFVQNDLRNSASDPAIKWIVATMHIPFYISPNECSAAGCEGDEELRDIYHPLFDKYGVDIVLQAHVRVYERSFPLTFNQESSSKPTITSTDKQAYKNPNGAIFAVVGTGGGELKHSLKGQAPYMAYQQDTDFGVLDIHFSDNKLDAKFVNNDGVTMDQFSVEKTAKKKVIESISSDTFADTNAKTISDKDTASKKPLVGQVALDSKPSITFKLDEDTTDEKKATLAGEDGKPSITFKLDEGAGSSSTTANANPMELSQGKPAITFKLEDATADNANTEPAAGHEAQEVKQAVSTTSDDITSTQEKPMLLSEEPVKQEHTTPAMTTKIDDSENQQSDDKTAQTSQESADVNDKSISFDSSDNADNSNGNNDLNDEDLDTTVTTINTNMMDPFARLN